MKSKRVNTFIDKCIDNITAKLLFAVDSHLRRKMIHAAELAEQDAEKRVQKKAIEAFKRMCVFKDQRCKPNCKDCWSLGRFIKEMSDDE